MVSPGGKGISSLENTILVTVCKMSQFDFEEAFNLGYPYGSLSKYFQGRTENESVLTWTGLHGNLTFNETINHLFKVDSGNVGIKGIKNLITRILLPYGICSEAQVLLHDMQVRGQGLCKVSIDLVNEGQYYIFISDPSVALGYSLPYNFMTGDGIYIDATSKAPTKKYYRVQLKEKQIHTEDGSCEQYSHDHSYADCVDEENRQLILPLLGCMVPWMSEQNQCSGQVV